MTWELEKELPTLHEQNRRMTTDITEDELITAINKLKLGESLGSDGYTAEWYKEFKDEPIPPSYPLHYIHTLYCPYIITQQRGS